MTVNRPTMRKSNFFFSFVAVCGLIIAILFLHALSRSSGGEAGRRYRAQLVQELGLTDLCLFTEARYTRHLSMADGHAPFQDHPVALEHFPSGALTTPPQLTQRHNDHTR